MSTTKETRSEASREDGKTSRGLTSGAGKALPKRNALRHGLRAEVLALAQEAGSAGSAISPNEQSCQALLVTRPHENGFGSGYRLEVRAWVEAVLGLVLSARNEHGPTSARLRSNPSLSPPGFPGEHEEETAPFTRSSRRPGHVTGAIAMDLMHRCCAGLDVHKKTVVACLRRVGTEGQVGREVRTYRTMTADLIALADWLDAEGASHVAMESTGVG